MLLAYPRIRRRQLPHYRLHILGHLAMGYLHCIEGFQH